MIACDADGCIKEHLDQYRSENADVDIQAKCAPILIEDLEKLFAGVTRKIHDLGPRAVYSYNGDYNDNDGLVFEVFAEPTMTVNTLDLIDQLINHDIYAGLCDLLMKDYPLRFADDDHDGGGYEEGSDGDEQDHGDEGDDDERVRVRRGIEGEGEGDWF